MIHVTENAVNHLRSLLAEQPEPAGKGLRVQVAKGGCSGLQYEMSLDQRVACGAMSGGATPRAPMSCAIPPSILKRD